MAEWANHGVLGQINWPQEEVKFQFGKYEFIALPATKDYEASLHIDLDKNHIDGIEAMSLMSQVLSMASWIDDAYAVLLNGFSGSTTPIPARRESRSFPSSIFKNTWPFFRKPISDPNARKAVALYREALNLERLYSLPYAALGYYKILEIRFKNEDRRIWLEAAAEEILNRGLYTEELLRIKCDHGPKGIADFLYTEGRLAVAHAKLDSSLNPDDIHAVRRLSDALILMRYIARKLIIDELGVSDSRWSEVVN